VTSTSPPAGWVPVDRRLWGMDRRAVVPAAVVAAFAVFSFWVLPGINNAVTVEDVVRAGDVVQVGESVTFAPAVGWNVEAGVRQGAATGGAQYPAQAEVTKGAVAFSITTGPFDGSPRRLLGQIRRNNDRVPASSAVRIVGQPVTFTTTTGQHGVLTRFSNGESVGLLAALVFDGTGVETVALGPDAIDNPTTRDIVAMFESVQPVSGQEGSAS